MHDVGEELPRVVLVAQHRAPELPHRGHVDGVEAELDEPQPVRLGDQTEPARGLLDRACQTGETLCLPEVLAAVDHHTLGPDVDHHRQPGVVGEGGRALDQVDHGSAIAGVEDLAAEHEPPVVGARVGVEPVVGHDRDEVDLVALRVGGVEEVRPLLAVRGAIRGDRARRLAAQLVRSRDVEVEPDTQRPVLGGRQHADRGVAAQRVDQRVGGGVVRRHRLPERCDGGRVLGLDGERESLQRSGIESPGRAAPRPPTPARPWSSPSTVTRTPVLRTSRSGSASSGPSRPATPRTRPAPSAWDDVTNHALLRPSIERQPVIGRPRRTRPGAGRSASTGRRPGRRACPRTRPCRRRGRRPGRGR